MNNSFQHVMYVCNKKDCKGCRIAMAILQSHPAKDSILVQDVDSLRKQQSELPAWLDGTPKMVEIRSRKLRKGREVIFDLLDILDKNEASCNLRIQTSTRSQDSGTDLYEEEYGGQEGFNETGMSAGCWDEEHVSEEDDVYDFHAGCDPSEMKTDKVTDRDVQKVLKERDMSK